MPAWLLQLLINIALSWGLPEVSKLIMKFLPWLSKDAVAQFLQIVADALAKISGGASKAAVRAEAHVAAKECFGVACESEPVKNP